MAYFRTGGSSAFDPLELILYPGTVTFLETGRVGKNLYSDRMAWSLLFGSNQSLFSRTGPADNGSEEPAGLWKWNCRGYRSSTITLLKRRNDFLSKQFIIMDQPFWEMKTDGEVSQLILEMEQQSDDGHRFNKIVTLF